MKLPRTLDIYVNESTSITTRLPDEFYPFVNNEDMSYVNSLILYIKTTYDIDCEYCGVQDGSIYFKKCSQKELI